jgi:transmembrane sensor
LRGAAHFAVSKDPLRPFVVSASAVEVRAVGTAFVVAFAAREVDVLVTEGQVAVAHAPSPLVSVPDAPAPEPVRVLVEARSRVTMPLDTPPAVLPEVMPVTDSEIARTLAWRSKRVEFSGARLVEALALFNRQNRLQLSLGDRPSGELRVSGIFWSDDPEGFTRLLEGSFGLRAERRSDTEITLRRVSAPW